MDLNYQKHNKSMLSDLHFRCVPKQPKMRVLDFRMASRLWEKI